MSTNKYKKIQEHWAILPSIAALEYPALSSKDKGGGTGEGRGQRSFRGFHWVEAAGTGYRTGGQGGARHGAQVRGSGKW